MLLDKIMELYPGPVRLTQTRWDRIATVVVGGLAAVLLLLLAYPGIGDDVSGFPRQAQVLIGLLLAPGGLLAVWWSVRELRRPHTVVMDAEGFRTTSPKGSRWHPWKDVDHFEVVSRGDEGNKVDFVLTYSDGQVEDCRFPDLYGFTAEALSTLMTRWRAAALPAKRKPGRRKQP